MNLKCGDGRPGRFRNFPSVSGLSVFVLQTLITPIGGRLGVFSFGYRVTELRLTDPAQVYESVMSAPSKSTDAAVYFDHLIFGLMSI